ncbi:MAG: hypothetical protein MAG471_00659 [Acidimicrobiaceae bacterium]|nr:hypothetical protein [Acidimicrobiaceae bacterium]
MFLGEDLLAWLLLALGGAMAVGNMAALIRPPARRNPGGEATGDLERPPLWRSLIYIVLGSAVSVWALVTLVA